MKKYIYTAFALMILSFSLAQGLSNYRDNGYLEAIAYSFAMSQNMLFDIECTEGFREVSKGVPIVCISTGHNIPYTKSLVEKEMSLLENYFWLSPWLGNTGVSSRMFQTAQGVNIFVSVADFGGKTIVVFMHDE